MRKTNSKAEDFRNSLLTFHRIYMHDFIVSQCNIKLYLIFIVFGTKEVLNPKENKKAKKLAVWIYFIFERLCK
jgi:hypothetical protein